MKGLTTAAQKIPQLVAIAVRTISEIMPESLASMQKLLKPAALASR